MFVGILGPVVLLVVVVLVIVAVQRRTHPGQAPPPAGGGDVLAYLLMAIAVGVAAVSLARLARAAFPGGVFIFDPEREVAGALAGIVVSAPFAVYLWRRQRRRRAVHPHTPGWTLYLSLIEATFMILFVIALFSFLDWLISDGRAPSWTDLLVYGGVIVFHELAVMATPPGPDSGELPRVIGSAIGLVPTMIGMGGALYWGLSELYSGLGATSPGEGIGAATSIAFMLTGFPVWWYRWLRRWRDTAGPARWSFTFLASTAGVVVLISGLTFLVAQTLIYLLTSTPPAGSHFQFLPATLSVALVAAAVWAHHRRMLGTHRDDPVRAYEYLSAAVALSAVVGGATILIAAVFGPRSFIGSSGQAAIVGATTAVFGVAVWYRFWSRAQAAPRAIEASTMPRRFYLLGLGVVAGLVSAGALIATLVFVFQRLLGIEQLPSAFVPMIGLFLSSGLAAAHLFRTYLADREVTGDEKTVAPFDVTVICTHPGMLADRLPKGARVRVIYRADAGAEIDDEMADRVVAAVDGKSSIVWVDETGFRVAPAR